MYPAQASASAAQDFHRARRQAAIRDIIARLKGEAVGLLSYEDVRSKLKAHVGVARGLRDIPLNAIVGSVGRYNDFTRDFLPKQDSSKDRWIRVKLAVSDLSGVPPIDVYQIGEAYFVLDGNHRVSVARQLGATHIQANVIEVQAKVTLSSNVRPDEIIIKSEYADFLEVTKLDITRPMGDLSVTVPGQYRQLEEHIQVHQYFMGLEQKRNISSEEAAAHWYDNVYWPVIHVIQERGILRDFPERTETDLYLWLAEHRATLEKELGWEVKPEAAASDLTAQYGLRKQNLVTWLSQKIWGAVLPAELETGPPPGAWRREKGSEDRLFVDLLVPVNGQEEGWNALEQAILVAQREGAKIHGLHVVPTEEDKDRPEVKAVKEAFDRHCNEIGLTGELVIANGLISSQISNRGRWVDLLVVNLAYPPASQPLAKLNSGFSNLVRRSPRPILAVPGKTTSLNSALLAYDGSPKAEEALFIATYLAARWGIPLVVVTVFDDTGVAPETLMRAKVYLEEHGIEAKYESGHGPVAETILIAAEGNQSDMIIIGGYGNNPIMETVLGSTVDNVLRKSRRPMLICR